MRRVSIAIAVCFVLALAISVVGQGRDLDAIMKEIGPLWQTPQTGLNAALDSPTPDYAKIATDAAKLQSLFTEAEAQFSKMKMTEAAGFAKAAARRRRRHCKRSQGRKTRRCESVCDVDRSVQGLPREISRERWRWWFQAEDAVVQEFLTVLK